MPFKPPYAQDTTNNDVTAWNDAQRRTTEPLAYDDADAEAPLDPRRAFWVGLFWIVAVFGLITTVLLMAWAGK